MISVFRGKGFEKAKEMARAELTASGIDPAFWGKAVYLESSFRQGYGGEWEAPLYDILGWHRSKFPRTAYRTFYGLVFAQEDGSVWQTKLYRAEGQKEYRAPTGIGNVILEPPIPDKILAKICQRHDLDFATTKQQVTLKGGFWRWFKSTKLPLIITEGAKKALCALSHGYVAISLYGCTCGKSPELLPFYNGREIRIAFDRDTKPTAAKAVRQGIRALQRAGKLTNCKIVQWKTDLGKGLDDLIAGNGVEAFDSAHDSAVPFPLWNGRQIAAWHQPHATTTTTTPCLSQFDLDKIPQSGIIALVSGLGTGKTKLISRIVQHSPAVIALIHRVTLGRSLASQLDLTYITGADFAAGHILDASGEPTKRIALCYDSTKSIPPNAYPEGSYDLVLDELDQGLWHLLLGGTVGANGKRPAIADRVISLIQRARRVIVASGTMHDYDLALLSSLRDESPWVLQNTYQGNTYPASVHVGGKEAYCRAMTQIRQRLQAGERAILTCDWRGTVRFLRTLAMEIGIPQEEILEVNSYTAGEHIDFFDAPDKTEWLQQHNIRLLIHNSALASGVSIESTHFDFVAGIFRGSTIAPPDALQQLARYRPSAPRIVYTAHRSHGSSAGFTPDEVRQNRTRMAKIFTHTTGRSFPAVAAAIETYCATAEAHRNRLMAEFGSALIGLLEQAGHRVTINPHVDVPPGTLQHIRYLEQLVRDEEDYSILCADPIPHEEALQLRKKARLTEAERYRLQRYELVEFEAIAPDELQIEQVRADRGNKRSSAVNRLEDAIVARLARDKDEALCVNLSLGKTISTHDYPKAEMLARTATHAGVYDLVLQCINADYWDKDTPWVASFCDRVRYCANEFHQILGFNPAKMTNCQIVGETLARFAALKTIGKQFRTPSGIVRRYTVCPESLESLRATLARRWERHRAAGRSLIVSPLVKALYSPGCYQPPSPTILGGDNPQNFLTSPREVGEPPPG